MSRYIGKRVSYPCHNCNRQCTINRKTVEIEDGVLCTDCSKKFRKAEDIFKSRLKLSETK